MTQDYDSMDAVAMLKADHRSVEALFAEFEQTDDPERRRALANRVCLELKVHAVIEEEIFYPACNGVVEEDLLKEAYVEHDGAKLLINEIEAIEPSDPYYDAKVMVLGEMVDHHVEEEERRVEGLFAQAREAGLDMNELADAMRDRRETAFDEYSLGAPAIPTTLRTQQRANAMPWEPK
jgi:hemerythrin superfamily protein